MRRRAATDTPNPQKVMVAAHMDEIGIMVSHITEKGFLRFTNIGGVHSHTLLGGRVRFADGTIGIIGADRIDDRNAITPNTTPFDQCGNQGDSLDAAPD